MLTALSGTALGGNLAILYVRNITRSHYKVLKFNSMINLNKSILNFREYLINLIQIYSSKKNSI